MLENTEGAITNGQSREYRRGNHKWTIQRIPKGQSKMDNPENTEGAITNGQSRETGNKTKTNKPNKNTTQYVLDMTIHKQRQIK